MSDERPIREIEAGKSLEEIFANATPDSDGWFDTPLIPWVRRINRVGIETMQSCSGHSRKENKGFLSEGHLSFKIPDNFDVEKFVRNLIEKPGIRILQKVYHPWSGMIVGFLGKCESEESMKNSMDFIELAIAEAME